MRYSPIRYISLFFCFCIALIIATTAYAQSIIYVNHAATGANDGTSWTHAFTFLQDALQAAQSGDEVWVAQGVYRPDQGASVVPGDREASFSVPSGLLLYGGFLANETARDQRNWGTYKTILNGDLQDNDNDELRLENPLRIDNTFRVVSILDLSAITYVDGFSITGGMGNEPGFSSGSGIRINSHLPPGQSKQLYISNCTFSENVSRGSTIDISVSGETNDPLVIISNSTVQNNYGITTAGVRVTTGPTLIMGSRFTGNIGVDSGAIRITDSEVHIFDSVFDNNATEGVGMINFGSTDLSKPLFMWNNVIANNYGGGTGIRISDGTFISINNVFTGNTTSRTGPVIRVNTGRAKIINNVFAFNSAVEGGSVFDIFRSNTSISNSIFWENSSQDGSEFFSTDPNNDTLRVAHSRIQSSLPDWSRDIGGNIYEDPLFQDADGIDNIPGTIDDDFQVLWGSPVIDAGANDSLFADFWDLDNDGDFDEFWPTDFYGDPRIIGIRPSSFPVVDLGPFEFNGPPPVAIEEDELPAPNGPSILGLYPNPFASKSSIIFTLDHPSEIRIEVYDILGKRVRVLDEGFRAAGEHEVTFGAEGLSTGVYFLKLTTGGFSQTTKMVLMR